MNERDITAFLHTRAAAMLMLAIAFVLAWIAFMQGDVIPIGGPLGIGLTPAREWTGTPLSSMAASMACTISMGVLIIYVNRAFNVLRSLTSLVAGMFFVMQTALPSVLDRFYGGDLMGVLMLLCIVLLFGAYGDGSSQRSIFLIFFLIALAGFTDLSYLLYLPVFMIGCVQMRIFDFRTFLAAGMGVVTPPWILFGFGLVDPQELHWPEIVMAWSMFKTPEVIQALAVTGFTLICAVGFTVANLLKILSYNSRIRAYNGFLTLMLGATGLFAILNFNNFAFYIPLLNCLTAYQIAHFFTYRRNRRSYIPILLLVVCYLAFYLWGILG